MITYEVRKSDIKKGTNSRVKHTEKAHQNPNNSQDRQLSQRHKSLRCFELQGALRSDIRTTVQCLEIEMPGFELVGSHGLPRLRIVRAGQYPSIM